MTETETYDITDMLALDLEYKLTVGMRIYSDCDCAMYFVQRREVLFPEILKKAKKEGTDPIDVFAAYARGVHARHADTKL